MAGTAVIGLHTVFFVIDTLHAVSLHSVPQQSGRPRTRRRPDPLPHLLSFRHARLQQLPFHVHVPFQTAEGKARLARLLVLVPEAAAALRICLASVWEGFLSAAEEAEEDAEGMQGVGEEMVRWAEGEEDS